MIRPARGLANPLVLWPAGAFAVYLLGASIGAASALVAPGVPLNPTNAIGSAMEIFVHNLLVLALISSGAVTLGITTVAALFLNGGAFGFVATELLQRHQLGMLITAAGPQLLPELGAYVIAAGASLRLGWSFWWPLVSHTHRTIRWRQWLIAESAAAFMLFVGAVLEAAYSHV